MNNMWNGFDLPKQILDEHLDFIREEIERMNVQIEKLESLKSYQKDADDTRTLLMGYMKLKTEMKSLFRHDYDAEQ